MSDLNTVCPGCGEHQVDEVAPAGTGPLAALAFYACSHCAWFGNERALRCGEKSNLSREVRDCLAEDRQRGEPGGSSSSGSPAKPKPPWVARPEQDATPLWADTASRMVQGSIRDQLFAAKFTNEEAMLLCAAIGNTSLTRSKWIQRALLASARAEIQAYQAVGQGTS